MYLSLLPPVSSAEPDKVETSEEGLLADGASSDDGLVWKPETAVSEFRFMMEEKEFNIKLVELKQGVGTNEIFQQK